jgi:uncharacterized protein
MMTRRSALFAVLVLCYPACLFAADDSAGITVAATGEAAVKPNRMEVKIKTSSAAELTSDAVVKHREAIKRVKEAFEKLKIENLKIDDGGLGFTAPGAANPRMAMIQGQATETKHETDISKSLTLSVTGIEKLSEEDLTKLVARVLDAVRDTGATVEGETEGNNIVAMMNGMGGSNTIVTFVADDSSEARRKATEAAYRSAREKAAELAKLSGAKLGPVLAMEESAVSGGKDKSMQEQLITTMYGIGSSDSADTRMTSQAFKELPVRIKLRVRFALQN